MKRTSIEPPLGEMPEEFRKLCEGYAVYDNSCSPDARVIYIERDRGYFLKESKKGSLETEAELARYFHRKGLTAPVLAYRSDEKDWLLTERVPGEDLTDPLYLSAPERLADTLGETLRHLHGLGFSDCPIQNRMQGYFDLVEENYKANVFDLSYCDLPSVDEAYRTATEGRSLLKNDTLLHGDYCLPNIILDRWIFSGFIDLGRGGVGDRHVDIFWGAWTLNFNLHTDKYRDRFFDAYGRDRINNDALDVIAAAEVFG